MTGDDPLDPARCYRAFVERDSNYDGVFFIAVRTTGIYCRTTCKTRKAKFENCSFYPDAKMIDSKGYRPCFRCRPDLTETGAGDAITRLASAAIKRIYAGALTNGTVEQLSKELKVSSRHLRRALQHEYQKSPLEITLNYRLQIAEELLVDSKLSIAEIAAKSGFSSVRRFNEVFLEKYRASPNKLRKLSRRKKTGESDVE
jgi:AraC family transcriptional regulator of adaptative response / DNA-3-methyladenine glycosylase II